MSLASISSLASALATLNSLIQSGVEYPDAHWTASSTHQVDADALQALYDAQSSDSNVFYEALVQSYVNEDMTRSDAQAMADADLLYNRLAQAA